MRICLKQIFLLWCMSWTVSIAMAQVKTVHAKTAKGKLTRSEHALNFIRSFKALPDAKASSLAKTANEMLDEICRMPQLSRPVGFNANADVATYDLHLKEKEPVLKVVCFLRYLVKDDRTGEIKQSLDGTDLDLDINGFDLFSQMGNYWKECNQLKFPLFFEQVPLSDSTNDYIAFLYKGLLIRMVLANNKPLFIPLTRKEFIQFLIARGQNALKEDQEALETSIKSKDEITKLMAAENKDDKAYSASALKTMDYNIDQWKKNIQKQEQENEACKSKLNSMTPQEAAAPARMDYNIKGTGTGMGSLNQLMPAGSKEGVLLTKLNPDYYNHSLNAPTAQLITIHYVWPIPGNERNLDYLQQTTVDIFNHLDYHALKMSMQ